MAMGITTKDMIGRKHKLKGGTKNRIFMKS